MAFQFSAAVRNAMLDAIETTIGTSVTLEIRSGAAPANAAAADSGTVLATITLPSDWLAAASAGSKAIANGPWTDASADATGTAGHFRVKVGATCHIQGTVGTTGADMNLSSTSIVAGGPVNITGFTMSIAA
jgi:hypothetical protein